LVAGCSWRAVYAGSDALRSCGECSACCTVLAVNAIGKPADTACPNECNGCAIYESRPAGCRSYRCAWLDGELSHDDRPDGLGLVADSGSSNVFGSMWGPRARVARELWPGGGAAVVADMVSSGRPVMLRRHGGGVEFKTSDPALLERYNEMQQIFEGTT